MPNPKKEKCSEKDDLFARTNEGDGYMQCQIHLRNSAKCSRDSSSPKPEEWEERFDKEFVPFVKDNSMKDWTRNLPEVIANYLTLKSFIKNVLLSQQKEVLKAVLEKLPNELSVYEEAAPENIKLNEARSDGFNSCLQEIKKSLKELDK